MKTILSLSALVIALATPLYADEVKILSTGLFRGVLPTLAPEFEKVSGHKVAINISTPGVLRDRLLKGEAFDVVFAPASFNLDQVAKSGVFQLGSRKDIGRTYIGVATLSRAPKPDLSTIEAVKRMIVGATAIALTDPAAGAPIGRHVEDVADRLGFGAELKSP